MSHLRQYYEDELSHLREQGRLFSERYPKLAPFLAETSQDPDIERLLEGFAFISAKLKCKIDDAYPELSQQFLELIAPLYFRAQPSHTILQFHPNPSMSAEIKIIPKGVEVMMAKGADQYGMSTLYDLKVQPLELTHLDKKTHQNEIVLTLNFCTLYGADTHNLKGMQFFIQGDLRHSYLISYLLLEHLNQIRFCVEGQEFDLPKVRFQRLGLKADSQHCFETLCHYFVFPEQFLFLELEGIDFESLPKVKAFSLKLHLNFDDREHLKISEETFVLHATPAVNLWTTNAEPLSHQSEKIDYILKAQTLLPGAAVHSILRVQGWSETKKANFEYLPASAFPVQQAEFRRYQTKLKESSIEDHPEVYLELWNPDSLLADEVISTEILAYQPLAFLEVNGRKILKSVQAVEGLDFIHILPFSSPVYPPLQEQVSWKLITHLALRFKNIQDIGSLKQLIVSYDFSDFQPGRSASLGRRIADALLEVATRSHQHFHRGEIIHGFLSVIKLKEDIFLNRGEVFLFGSILARILAEHASFNSFHELALEGVLTGVHFSWPTLF
ncbi:MAG: type VI secretion system baseplate subunit TssF [Gammaproteobacteria bacterium]|nr:type VI secretion system baseplate subunit TssF [Gammaproteobacteria bacterium]